MRALWVIFRTILRDQRVALLRGGALGLIVVLMGVALLGLSGWFITAAAAAGLAGAGAVFDVFRPSALVRFLALGRAAARYGERMLTHDATLRALQTLRGQVLAGMLAAPLSQMSRLRGAQALNRLTADIDALDGVPLRLVLPVLAGVAAQIVAFAALWWLVAPEVALWVLAGSLLGAALILTLAARRMLPLSRRVEAAAQAFRARLIDLIGARRDLTVYGRLVAQVEAVQGAEARRLALRRELDRADRRAGAALGVLGAVVTAGALGIGMALVQAGRIEPAFAALGVFAALALGETLAPLRRAVSDLGRMADAARRVTAAPGATPPPTPLGPVGQGLRVSGLTLLRPGTDAAVVSAVTFAAQPGQTLALVGPSGAGKSTLLLALAGLHPVAAGQITLAGRALSDWPEAALRDHLALLPQRSALMAGTVAEALHLAGPADDATLWSVLEAVQLADLVRTRGGLPARIGPRGEGLSGGEARRLALARVILRHPQVLLLDEPTEGLDDSTARAVMAGLRRMLPQVILIVAAHRPLETEGADAVLTLN